MYHLQQQHRSFVLTEIALECIRAAAFSHPCRLDGCLTQFVNMHSMVAAAAAAA